MKKRRREGGVDAGKLPITEIVYSEGGYFGAPAGFEIDVRFGIYQQGRE